MKDMRPVNVNVDVNFVFRKNIARNVGAFVDDEAFFARFFRFVSKNAAEQPRADDEIIKSFHI